MEFNSYIYPNGVKKNEHYYTMIMNSYNLLRRIYLRWALNL